MKKKVFQKRSFVGRKKTKRKEEVSFGNLIINGVRACEKILKPTRQKKATQLLPSTKQNEQTKVHGSIHKY